MNWTHGLFDVDEDEEDDDELQLERDDLERLVETGSSSEMSDRYTRTRFSRKTNKTESTRIGGKNGAGPGLKLDPLLSSSNRRARFASPRSRVECFELPPASSATPLSQPPKEIDRRNNEDEVQNRGSNTAAPVETIDRSNVQKEFRANYFSQLPKKENSIDLSRNRKQ